MKNSKKAFYVILAIFFASLVSFGLLNKLTSLNNNNLQNNVSIIKQKYYSNKPKWIGLGLIQNKSTEVKVAHVIPDGPAMKAGLQKGDIIKKINGNEVKKIQDLQKILNPTPVNHGIILSVTRNSANIDLYVQVKSTISKNLK